MQPFPASSQPDVGRPEVLVRSPEGQGSGHYASLVTTPSRDGLPGHGKVFTPPQRKIDPSPSPTNFKTPETKSRRPMASPQFAPSPMMVVSGGHQVHLNLDSLSDIETPKTPCSSDSNRTLGGSGFKPGKEDASQSYGLMMSPPKSDKSDPTSEQRRRQREFNRAQAAAITEDQCKSNMTVVSTSADVAAGPSSGVTSTTAAPNLNPAVATHATQRVENRRKRGVGSDSRGIARRCLGLEHFFSVAKRNHQNNNWWYRLWILQGSLNKILFAFDHVFRCL